MTNELVDNIKDNVTRSMDTLDNSVNKTNNAITSSLDNIQSSIDGKASKELSEGMEKVLEMQYIMLSNYVKYCISL